jgi:O-antigen biosynthesis protein
MLTARAGRITVSGRMFCCGAQTWYVKGLTYGPFELNSRGQHLPERPQLLADLRQMRDLGCNV